MATAISILFSERITSLLGAGLNALRTASIVSALKFDGLWDTYIKLETIVPDITSQYTDGELASDYVKLKVRAQHAFQVFLFEQVFRYLKNKPSITIVDIGDSAGTHLQYVRGLYANCVSTLSVNLDPVAIEKIRAKGLEAICARAEDLKEWGVKADVYLCYEMLEHLRDPSSFLHGLSAVSGQAPLIVTVPYVSQSRVALDYIRSRRPQKASAETTHVFELSPSDWRLLFLYSGWRVQYQRIFLQYPRMGLLRLMKREWQRSDYEGFYGAVLTPDSTWSGLYQSW